MELRDNYGMLKDRYFLLIVISIMLVLGVGAGTLATTSSKKACENKAKYVGIESEWDFFAGCMYREEGQIVRIN